MKRGALRTAVTFLCCWATLVPLTGNAAPVRVPGYYGPDLAPRRDALPVQRQSGTSQGISGIDVAGNRMTVRQDQSKAVIDWDSFNIGADAHVHFDQRKNPNWAVLNRIFDASPSLIFGRLTADGKVYLINQNGILFGPGSRVDVNSLVASALNLRNSDFLSGLLKFRADAGQDYPGLTFDPRAAVSNYGEINAAAGGTVFLIGPRVENAGVIRTSMGQIGLAAGSHVELAEDPEKNRGLVVLLKDGPGEAWNREGGQLISDMGWAGIYGRAVHQDGLIRSVTAVKNNGHVELRATESITAGPNSVIESPILDSPETADYTFAFSGGDISMGGTQSITGTSSQKVGINDPPAVIELNGAVEAPSGRVAINAGGRVMLGPGSRINVAGAWSDETATANLINVQMNSVDLRDAFLQKDGPLKGQTISVNILSGSSVGDVSKYITQQNKTALENAVNGGTIDINVTSGDIIVKKGSALDVSGGAIRYSGGALETTKVLVGTRLYDIGSVPANTVVSRVLGQFTKTHERFGVTEKYTGIYYGGAAPVQGRGGSFTKGGDAGTVTLNAGRVILEERVKGTVTRGLFQTNRTLPGSYANLDDYNNALALSRASGLEMPAPGTLNINSGQDPNSQIVISRDGALLPEGFSASDPLASGPSVIRAGDLSASIGSLNLTAARISSEEGSSVRLLPGGSFNVYAGNVIDLRGEVYAPSGDVTLKTTGTNTGGIFIGKGGRLDVSGERIDNSLAWRTSGAPVSAGLIQGGTITIEDKKGVFVNEGAVLDVSGGYQVDVKRKITAGSAGTLVMTGPTMMLNGGLRGHALADVNGKVKGGRVILRADEIDVTGPSSAWPGDFTAGSAVPDALKGKLVLSGDRFADTGFTRIELDSFNDTIIGAPIGASLVRLRTPEPTGGVPGAGHLTQAASSGFGPVPGRNDLIRLNGRTAFEAGTSEVTVNAGGMLYPWQKEGDGTIKNSSASLTVSAPASIRTAPEGRISLSASGLLTMAGTLESISGQINLTSASSDLIIKESGRVLAGGYNRPDTSYSFAGYGYNQITRPGGQVSLTAGRDLTVESGSLMDISGSGTATNRVRSGARLLTYSEAGDPGSLSMTFGGNFSWKGEVDASAKSAGVRGGTLTLYSKNPDNVFEVWSGDLARYRKAGFDDLTVRSYRSLKFIGTADETFGRKLTLDAPEVSVSGQDSVTLRSPWITLANTALNTNAPPAPGDGQLTLSSTGWMDLNGQVNLSGLKEVSLEAARDIRLSDYVYNNTTPDGRLTAAGGLTLKAGRIYPTTLSKYLLKSTGGKVTVLPSDAREGGLIYSAGGDLTVEAMDGIEVRGTLAAPLGTIILRGTGQGSRIYLAEGGVVSSAGSAMVNYGGLDDNGVWLLYDKATQALNKGYAVNAPPDKSITLDAPEVITRSGSTVEVSGGGSVFAYDFKSGAEGTDNPLTKPNRFVIMGDRSISMPGSAVSLNGGGGLGAGTYSLLPAEFAFLPGAVVLEEQKLNTMDGRDTAARDGYSLVIGYSTVSGTGIKGARPRAFSVIAANEVLKQGNFTVKSLTGGDAGGVTVKGSSTVMNGQVRAAALNGYTGGKISLSGKDVLVQQTAAQLPDDFDFSKALDQGLRDKLSISAESLYGKGFQEIDLGDTTVTGSVTVREGSALEAPAINLSAKAKISVETGSRLTALAGNGVGEITFNSPDGKAAIAEGAAMHASHAITFNTGEHEDLGQTVIDHSNLTLSGAGIFFVPDAYKKSAPGLYITGSQWKKYSTIGEIKLISKSDMVFLDDFDLSVPGALSVDSARIGAGRDAVSISLRAPVINLLNTSKPVSPAQPAGKNGIVTVKGDSINIGGGDVAFGGFKTVNMEAGGALTFNGAGSLKTGGADLNIAAARVRGALAKTGAVYVPANFLADAGTGAINLRNSGGQTGASASAGGVLDFVARKIESSGVVESPSGTVRMTATGSGQDDGVFLRSGAGVIANGGESAPGGRVALRSDNGSVVTEAGSLIDVSAGDQGDAGTVTLIAPLRGVAIGGGLSAAARGGSGGSLVMDTKGLSESGMTGVIGKVADFTGSVDIRTRGGGINIAAGQKLKSRRVKLSADNTGGREDDDGARNSGNINVSGEVDTGVAPGGSVELYSTGDLNVNAGARVGSAGGDVYLSSAVGLVNVKGGASIDVSDKTAAGGTVYLRARRNGTGVNINLDGTVPGARAVYAEAVKSYDYNTTSFAAWYADALSYYNTNTVLLPGAGPSTFHLLPGIEVTSTGVINMAGLDLKNYRFGGEPGVLTLRAGGNLNINGMVVDHPSPMNALSAKAGRNSWAINLAAGADIAGADPLSAVRGQGDLKVSDNGLVYTEGAPVRFASGNDTIVGTGNKPSYMINGDFSYNLASYGGDIRGSVGRDLVITGGAVQTATGRIRMETGRDLVLNNGGSIRTTGQNPSGMTSYWKYAGGGDISLDVGRHVGSKGDNGLILTTRDSEWDQPYGARQPYVWAASYTKKGAYGPTSGIAAMGGGSLDVRTGGDFLAQAGTFGRVDKGDLAIYAGGNVRGRFLNAKGRAEVHAMGNFGALDAKEAVEAFDSRVNISAQGDLVLGAIVNPTIASDKFAGQFWNMGYTENTSVIIKAGGDVTIAGKSQFYNLSGGTYSNNERILPPAVGIDAGGSIHLMNDFALAPSSKGNLRLKAGADIDGPAVYVSDMLPSSIYTAVKSASGNIGDGLFSHGLIHGSVFDAAAQAYLPLHAGDGAAIEINAGRDIKNIKLFLPKRAEITAGRDIRDIYYLGQNTKAGDVSTVRAGRDVIFNYVVNTDETGLVQAGPGALILQAGNSIDLGSSAGIRSKGNENNPYLDYKGSALLIISGYAGDIPLSKADEFFGRLRDETRSPDSYKASTEKARAGIIPMLGAPSGAGNISMTVSQISTNYGDSGISIIANGALDVGKSTFFKDENLLRRTGILTSEGGAINIFTGGDVNVNESRVMTFYGGDITVWSDHGDINAGRGSKAEVNVTAKKLVYDPVLDRYVSRFIPPAVGSGIRAVSYDPDGPAGPLNAPPPGDIYPHARVIDAGEAGLAGGNIFMQGDQVLNAGNISSSFGSVVGMPQAASGTAAIGNMTGSGAAGAGASQAAQEAAGLNPSNAARASQMIEDIMTKWLDVKVINFVQGE